MHKYNSRRWCNWCNLLFIFAKAFDTVPYQSLLWKLKSYGIKGRIFEWIKVFLVGRSQIVTVNGEKSASATVISNIPQGSVLGPVLFVIYINDMMGFRGWYEDFPESFISLWCFDALILQSDINLLEEWSKKWHLKFKLDKCHVLTLGKFDNITYTYRNRIYKKEIEHVFEEKNLGVLIDADLSFEHISANFRKANAIIGLIRRSFSFLDCKSFVKIFTVFVRPHLEYA